MMSSGFLSEAVSEHVNTKLEAAIEDLRVKYERKAKEETAVKAEESAAAAAAGSGAAPAPAPAPESDWTMDDPDLEALRRSRMAALKSTSEARKAARAVGGGELRTIAEDAFLREVTAVPQVIVHFFHPEFETCKVMDKHLRLVAAKPVAVTSRFLRIDATKAPFFVAKLKVKVLPTLIVFRDGVAMGRQVGYEGLDMVTSGSSSGAGGGITSASAMGSGVVDSRSVDFTTASLYKALKAGGAFGDDAAKRADSDSEGEDAAGGEVASRLAAARKRMVDAAVGDS